MISSSMLHRHSGGVPTQRERNAFGMPKGFFRDVKGVQSQADRNPFRTQKDPFSSKE